MVTSIALMPDFYFRLEASKHKIESEKIENTIESIWMVSQKERGNRLTSDSLFNATFFNSQICIGSLTNYKRVLAQFRQPALFNTLRIRPVAVSGLLKFKNKIIFARRAKHVTQFPGYWELAPAGSLSPQKDGTVDIFKHLLLEMKEELGLNEKSVLSMTPIALIEDTESHIVDISIECVLGKFDSKDIRTDEYETILAVDLNEISNFCNSHNLISNSKEVLRFKNLCP